ncbi:MAG: CDP-alcohol phosphatidyltransferase family protein [Rhodobacteraceae bacterium]|jgi:phosphatidylglycerophosphate synthase|nr:CDP-alcohol phosphatidyltransferase family protein [Paracoccaceae bacterium]
MFDAALRPLIDPPLNAAGVRVARAGVTADQVTLMGLAAGLAAAVCIALGLTWVALVPLALSRFLDGLDGAVARATRRTDFGGTLDFACDVAFYGAVPFAFVVLDPGANGVAGAFLLVTFYVNAATFLGYAVLAERHRMVSHRHGAKTLYFTGGLAEGAETIAVFAAMCLWPSAFPWLAWGFGAVCLVTAGARLMIARAAFPPQD